MNEERYLRREQIMEIFRSVDHYYIKGDHASAIYALETAILLIKTEVHENELEAIRREKTAAELAPVVARFSERRAVDPARKGGRPPLEENHQDAGRLATIPPTSHGDEAGQWPTVTLDPHNIKFEIGGHENEQETEKGQT